ncbi:N-acetyldiaminopimelate deacetylase [Terribacillus halophilus]|jgi:N-acetyldiaminopimelate deacetylase|uniref:N-acetyldiaminopimelate deacetylase n=1 Tax=Terribacillus halophilus TaxID=361279 RepID=UPI000987560A|nr:N-acetyldiaminopimelate deacetylase [Terribacillus halophilus]
MENKLIQIRRDLHQIPELGFQEEKTQAYLLEYIQQLPQEHLQIKTWRTGIIVSVTGADGSKTIGFRTDIDGLPITEETGLPYESQHEGRMHACGHDLHMTIALGALTACANKQPVQNIVFIFQPAEEGPGGALPLLESGVLKEWQPDEIFALHIAPELPVGTVSSRPGILFANTSELFLDFKGKGGHAAYPHLTKDMVVAASTFITNMQGIVARNLDPLQSAVITIGKMESGFVQNTIAETARLEGTIRTMDPEAIAVVKQHIEQQAKGLEISHDCQISIDYGSNYYQVYNDNTKVEAFQKAIARTSLTYKEANPAMTGEDFGYMLKEIPGFMFWLGVNSPYGLHHSKLTPDEQAINCGVEAVLTYINEA